MMSVRQVDGLTKARSLFGDKNRLSYLTFFNATISFGRRKGYSRASAR